MHTVIRVFRKYPEQQGHDANREIFSPIGGRENLFVEISDIDPAMTAHLFGKLKGMYCKTWA